MVVSFGSSYPNMANALNRVDFGVFEGLSVVGRDVTTYTRWGRLYCPHGTSTVYKGAVS